MKAFNTAGTCRPSEHYMVDITKRLEISNYSALASKRPEDVKGAKYPPHLPDFRRALNSYN